MRSFRPRRQGNTKGDEGDDAWGIDGPLPSVLFDENEAHSSLGHNRYPAAISSHGGSRMRLGESLINITTPKTEDRELKGGRMMNGEAIYNMRKRWISDRLRER